MEPASTLAGPVCYHCGEALRGSLLQIGDKHFCCEGCETVYQVLAENNLDAYYRYNANPGASKRNIQAGRFDYLDEPAVQQQLLRFNDGSTATVSLRLPQIHCSSCIWLLEHLWKLNDGVRRVQVNFLRREALIVFSPQQISLRELAMLLDRIGYTPDLRLDQLEQSEKTNPLRPYWYRLGTAFFCFGNIMLLSFPEYFGLDDLAESTYRHFFGYLNFVLSLPVLLYSASIFFRSAITGLKQKQVNMDVPIVLGIIVMFVRSSWEIFSHTGAGYMDTLSGLVFLMLVGRLFQQKTYETLSFDRDYKSYFPAAVTVINSGGETTIPVSDIRTGDRLLIRHGELIPADGLLFRGDASVDYSFATGESTPVSKTLGEVLYAGGRQTGGAIELEVIKPVSQSYLTQLWNDAAFRKAQHDQMPTLANRISKVFTFVVLGIALLAGIFWLRTDVSRALNAFTAVLIITCPCALALSTPFTLGNLLRLLGRNKIYLKNTATIETLARANAVVFDKTGTITCAGDAAVEWTGAPLSPEERRLIHALARQSSHPLSRQVCDFLGTTIEDLTVTGFYELTGKGIGGTIGENTIRLGAATFTGMPLLQNNSGKNTAVHVSVNGNYLGSFRFHNRYRSGFPGMVADLRQQYALSLVSGDNDQEQSLLQQWFGAKAPLHFRQTPSDKLAHVNALQSEGHTVIMVGDGLNDAGALKQSDAGLAISDNVNNFSPACDGIIDASQFTKFPKLLQLSKAGVNIIKISFAISFLYNIAGIFFAVQGLLSPLVAAVLMPASSVTILLFTTLASFYAAQRYGFRLHPDETAAQ